MKDEKQMVDNVVDKKSEEVSFKRRQILHMGWTVPVVAALALKTPNTAFAQSVYTDYADHSDHTDGGHVDHSDGGHTDHSDHTDGKRHYDAV